MTFLFSFSVSIVLIVPCFFFFFLSTPTNCFVVPVLLLQGTRVAVSGVHRLHASSSSSSNNNDSNNNNNGPTPLVLFDRFVATCPASIQAIQQFDESLITTTTTTTTNNNNNNNNENDLWVAVYRSNQNQPSVLVKDEFLQAMKSATSISTTTTTTTTSSSSILNTGVEINPKTKPPVAIARFHFQENNNNNNNKNNKNNNYITLDTMRCILKKENMEESCDGGSEHLEALSTAIDTLLLQYLKTKTSKTKTVPILESVIYTKATLVAAPLLEQRGFVPLSTPHPTDITLSHVSSYEQFFEKYVQRSLTETSLPPGARQRAVEIVAQLGQIDAKQELQAAAAVEAAKQQPAEKNDDDENDDDDEYDPWASMKRINL